LPPKQSRFADSFENNGLASRLWESGEDEQAGFASNCFDAGAEFDLGTALETVIRAAYTDPDTDALLG
jgi:hypothetical protein